MPNSHTLQRAEPAGEEDERVFAQRGTQIVDTPYDNPVVACGMLGDDLAPSRVVTASARSGAPQLPSQPVETREPVGASRGGTSHKPLGIIR